MTGFGRAEVEKNGRSLVAEIRSVNHRFLETSIRLPRGLQPLENKLRSHLQENLTRGKINITVSWLGVGDDGSGLFLDMELARRYVDILQEVRSAFDFREPVTMNQVMTLPEVLKRGEPELEDKEAWAHLEATVSQAVKGLIEMRQTEGKAMAKDLMGRIKTIQTLIEAVEERAPNRVTAAKERLRTRITELLNGEARVDEERLILEAAFQAERMDCTEECVRLRSHLDQMEELLKKGEPAGRKLNFLAQEMNREANTIGSKANDITITREVIQTKEEIEIVREQIQNIE